MSAVRPVRRLRTRFTGWEVWVCAYRGNRSRAHSCDAQSAM